MNEFELRDILAERDQTYKNNKTGLKIVNYDDMLYPQYWDKFEKTITPSTWESIRKAAKEMLEADHRYPIHPSIIEHWKSIVAGNVPFGYVVKDETW